MHASQLHLLQNFADFRPHLFRKKVRVDPEIFDCILDEISTSPVFTSKSNNLQLPIAIQLAIFLNRAGHYRNAATPEDIAEWAGVSVGSVVNCTNHVMVVILDQHDNFVYVPGDESEDMGLAHLFAAQKTCTAWQGGIFAADGLTIDFFEKPASYGDTFTDQKGNYSLNCQVGEELVPFVWIPDRDGRSSSCCTTYSL